jgi:hypothetical protein
VGGFDDGGGSVGKIYAGVGGAAVDGEGVVGDTLAGGLEGSGGSGRLENEDEAVFRANAAGEIFGDGAGGGGTDLFVGNGEEGDAAGGRARVGELSRVKSKGEGVDFMSRVPGP